MHMKDRLFSEYIAKSHMGSGLTDSELKTLKEGNIDDMVSTFIRTDSKVYTVQIQTALKHIKKLFGDRAVLKNVCRKKSLVNDYLACQVMDGDIDALIGIAGNEKILLKIASVFAGEEFSKFDEDAYDSLCEYVNIISGAFASRLCDNDIEVALHPPVMYCDSGIGSVKEFYVITIELESDTFCVVMAADNSLKVSKKAAG